MGTEGLFGLSSKQELCLQKPHLHSHSCNKLRSTFYARRSLKPAAAWRSAGIQDFRNSFAHTQRLPGSRAPCHSANKPVKPNFFSRRSHAKLHSQVGAESNDDEKALQPERQQQAAQKQSLAYGKIQERWSQWPRKVLAAGLLMAIGLSTVARPASAARERPKYPTAMATEEASTSSRWREEGRRSVAAEKEQAGISHSRGWSDTGIELAEAEEDEDLEEDDRSNMQDTDVTMTIKEYDKYLANQFGDDPRYSQLFRQKKKGKKADVMKSRVPDPKGWETADPEPQTAWRTDRMKDLTYTQFWNLITEHQIDKVKYSQDNKTVLVYTKPGAPGGKRVEKVALPYDPDLFNHMVEHGVVIEVSDSKWALDNVMFGIAYLVWPVLVAVALFMGTMNMSFGPGDDEEQLFKGAVLDRLDAKDKKFTFADIAGIDMVKAEIYELVQFLRNPKRFLDLGARAPAGVLLVGNPGTGKTLLAKAIAGEAGVPFLSVAGTEFDELFVGVGAARVRDMFRQARDAAPCILFIDEFDGLGKQRSYSAASESANTINALLTEMDGFEDNTGVIVIGATNRPSALDSALTRPGRFDRVIQLPLPSIDGREEILRVHARDKKMANEVDFHRVARATAGYTGAQLMNVMNTAAIVAVRRGSTVVTTDDMFQALENIRHERITQGEGEAGEDDEVPLSVRRGVAVYEAARVLIGSITPDYDEVSKVSCCPGGTNRGFTFFIPQEEHLESRVITRAYMEAKMTVALAGRCAEKLVLGEANISTAGAGDLELANMIAREMVYKCGFSRRLGPVALMDSQSGYLRNHNANYIANIGTELAAIAFTDIQELVEGAEAKASFGLAVNYKALEALVEALVSKETLTGKEVQDILEANDVVRYPDPFVDGFGWDHEGSLYFPGAPSLDEDGSGNGAVSAEQGEDGKDDEDLDPEEEIMMRTFPPYPYRVRDDLTDLVSDELRVLGRLPLHRN